MTCCRSDGLLTLHQRCSMLVLFVLSFQGLLFAPEIHCFQKAFSLRFMHILMLILKQLVCNVQYRSSSMLVRVVNVVVYIVVSSLQSADAHC